MRTLFIAAGGPYPPRGGAPQRFWQNINVLATRGPVHVLSIGGREPGDYTMPLVAEWVHVDNADFPGNGGLRSFLMRFIAPRQYSLPDVFATSAVNKRVRTMIERVNPDVIVLSHWKNDYPAALRGYGNVVLDMHNVESLLGDDVQHIRRRWVRAFLLWRWRARERALVRQANCTWVCGLNDAEELKRLGADSAPPVIWPNSVDLDYYADVREGKMPLPAGAERNGATLIFVGIYSYGPNRQAAAELLQYVLPLVFARLAQARCIFVGAAPPPELCEAARRDPRIIVTGKVADVRQFLAVADVSIMPIRTGGGTRAKILECFAAKIPVVCTAKAVEGIDAVAGRDVRIAESPATLAEDALELLADPAARSRQTEAAYDLVQRSYSWASLAERLDDALPPSLRTTEPAAPRA